jgi:peptide/nickel transport system substrate-binding protein
MEAGQQWDALVNGDYDIGVMWWVNDVFDPDEKAEFCVSGDPEKRKQMYFEIQRIAKDDVHWIDLYYSPFRNASRTNVKGFVQNPLGRYMLETADIVD